MGWPCISLVFGHAIAVLVRRGHFEGGSAFRSLPSELISNGAGLGGPFCC